MRQITVEPGQLESCASRIDDRNQDYMQNCQELFNAIDAMSAAWQGEDNTAFTTQISRFNTDFRQLSMLCGQYADFLRSSARAYRETQDELTSQASRLAQ